MRTLVAVLTVAAALPATASAAPKRCGDIARIGEGGTEIAAVKADGVGCKRARHVLVRHTLGRSTAGWTCNSAGSEAVCTRGGAVARYGPARSRGCGSIAFTPNSDDGAGDIRARHVSCRVARKVARKSKPFGPSHPDPYTARGFRCRGRHLPSAGLETALYTCQRGRATVAFQRS
jgi:hypothetical protein